MRGAAFVAAAFALVTLAGCLEDDPGTGDGGGDGNGRGAGMVRVGEWPSGASARNYIESYVMTHPFRVHGEPYQSFMDAARADLFATLAGFSGLSVVEQPYEGDDPGVNILAIQEGTAYPNSWVVLSAHYDTVGAGGIGPTVYGAWDDGAGTAALIELARSLSTWEFPFTVVYAFFDGEEKGLKGSQAFVEAYGAGKDVQLVANLNTDPPGLNWPCGDAAGVFPVKVIEEPQKVAERADYAWLSAALEHALATVAVPAEALDRSGGIPIATVNGVGLTGGSDHQSFGDQDIPNVFIGGVPLTIVGGTPDEHVAAGMTYPLHTPLDTLEAMEARCTVGSLAEGLQTTVDLFGHALTQMGLTY